MWVMETLCSNNPARHFNVAALYEHATVDAYSVLQ